MRRTPVGDRFNASRPSRVKICLSCPVPEMFAKFANFDRFKSSPGAEKSMTGLVTHPSSSGESPLLNLGQDDAVRRARAAGRMPGGEELTRDLRSNEPESPTGVRDLRCLQRSQRPAPEERWSVVGRSFRCRTDALDIDEA